MEKVISTNPVYLLASPHAIVLWLCVPMVTLFYFLPDSAFILWGTGKSGDEADFYHFLACLSLFFLGSCIGSAMRVKNGGISPISDSVPIWYLRGGLIISVAAYLVWFSLAVHRTGGIASLIAMRAVNPWSVKSDVMATVPGLTTLTQVAVIAIPLMILFHRNRAAVDRWLIYGIMLLAAIRSYLNSERLALLEVLLPAAFLLLIKRQLSWRVAILSAVGGLFLVIVFFTISEVTRSFVSKDISSYDEVAFMSFIRFIGYYQTSINNAILLIDQESFSAPLYTILRPLWAFPGMDGAYRFLVGGNPVDMHSLLEQSGLSLEYNTAAEIGAWVVDFGTAGSVIWGLLFGVVLGSIWRSARSGRLSAALYSVLLVGLLEFMRMPYLTSTRLFPAYLFIVGALILIEADRKRRSDGS